MPKIVNLLFLVFGVIMMGTGLARLRNHPNSWPMLVAGIAVVALAWLGDNRRTRHAQERKHAAIQERIAELTGRARGASSSLRIPASPWLIPGTLLLVIFGAGILYLGMEVTQDWRGIAGGAFFLVLGFLALGRALGGIGHPALELNTSSVVTPLNGRIYWRDITGIFLWTFTRRTGGKTYRILFHVKNIARTVERIHWTDRLFAAMHFGALVKGMVNVWLPSSKEPPEAVYALARLLWKQATGNDYEWNPMMSDRYNEAAQRSGGFIARLQEPSAVEPSMANVKRIKEGMAQARGDIALMRGETRHRFARFTMMQGIMGLMVLLALLATVTSLFLSILHK